MHTCVNDFVEYDLFQDFFLVKLTCFLNLLFMKIGLSASTIASSFGKAISENKELEDYKPEDISLSLLRMISYNIGQVSCKTAG